MTMVSPDRPAEGATTIGVNDAAQYLLAPADTWTARGRAALVDRAPALVHLADGTDAWSFDGGRVIDPVGLEAAAARASGAVGMRTSYGALRPAACDPAARLAEMDDGGIRRASIFPTYALNVLNTSDRPLHVALVRAYNDAVVEWCASGDPSRLVPHALIPATGLDDATEELDRVLSLGVRGIVFGGWPSAGRIPDPADDRFWARCQDAGAVVELLRGGPANPDPATRGAAPASVGRYMGGDGTGEAASALAVELAVTDLVTAKNHNLSWFVLTGVLERFPALRVLVVQAGAGWLATCGELLDWNYRYAQFVPGNGFARLRDLPSDSIRQSVYATVESDQRSLAFLDAPDRPPRTLWATGFPTSIAVWPNAQLTAELQLHDVSPSTKRLVVSDNFTALYGTGS
jgi:predicted TIM-barrel fold metal-dependent hydrolase